MRAALSETNYPDQPSAARAVAFADRRRVLPDEYRKRVTRMNGDIAQTFPDGLVAASWCVASGRVAIEPFTSLSRSVQHELEDEAGRLEPLLPDGCVARR